MPRDLVLGLQVASLRAAVAAVGDADLTTVAGVTGLLAFLMPDTFASDWLASLARRATRNLEGLMPWSAGAEVSALLEGVDLSYGCGASWAWGGGLPLSLPCR